MQPQLSMQLLNFSAADPGPGGWQNMLDLAVAADRAGIDRVVIADHVVMGENLEAYGDPSSGGTEGGRQPTGSDGHWLEPLTTLSHFSALTSNVRLGTSILIAALRTPAVLAKSLATLDVLSGGRVDLGVGVGWQREEYLASGLPFEGRGARLDDSLEALQSLWTSLPASHHSDFLDFDGIYCVPQPIQEGGIPIWVSGTVNKRVAARIARFGSGWIPWGPAASDPVSGLAEMAALVEAAGGSMAGIQMQGGLVPVADAGGGVDVAATMAQAPALIEAGITDCRMRLPVPTGLEAATDYLSEAVAAFRDATS
jgi:probable F420-dependent oxidoreductase